MADNVSIYFLQWGKGGPIKIGRARDIYRRIRELQIACFAELKLLHYFDGSPDIELSLHELLDEHRIRGEWFKRKPALALLAQIKELDGAEVYDLTANMLLDATREYEERQAAMREPPLNILRPRRRQAMANPA